jgi:hypothetical protein
LTGLTGLSGLFLFFLTSRLPAIVSRSGEAGGDGSEKTQSAAEFFNLFICATIYNFPMACFFQWSLFL